MEQRSNEWFKARAGRITASSIHKIMGVKGLGKTGESYCFDLAIEKMYGIDEDDDYVSPDIKRGIELEPLAFRKFKEIKMFDFINVEECTFFPYGQDAGATPDGLVGKDSCLEIKCPKPAKFFKLVKFGSDAIDKEYVYQMQMQMLCTNSKQCYFFNYIIYNTRPMWHTIIVQRDESIIDKLETRINEGIMLRNQIIEEIKSKEQFN